MKKLLLIVFTNFILFSLFGQEIKRSGLEFQVGMGSLAIKDKGVSALRYNGIGYHSRLAFHREDVKKHLGIRIHYQRGVALANSAGVGEVFTNQAALLNHTLYKTKWQDALYLGWTNHNVLHVSNASISVNFNGRMQYSTNLGFAAKWCFSPPLFAERLSLDLYLFYQLIGFKINSGMVSSTPDGFLEPNRSTMESVVYSMSLYNPLNNTEVGFLPSLAYTLNNGNKFGLNYEFHFFKSAGFHQHRRLAAVWSLFFNGIL